MRDSCFSVRSAPPQVIVPQPVLSLVCVGAVVSPNTWPESACRAGVVVSTPSPDISSEPSASSDHAMADASPAVTDSVTVCSASGSDPTAPVPVSY